MRTRRSPAAWAAGAAAVVALACLVLTLTHRPYALLSRARAGSPASTLKTPKATSGGTVAARLLRNQALSGAFVSELVKGVRRDLKHVERDGSMLRTARAGGGAGAGGLPSMRQVLRTRRRRDAERAREEKHYRRALGARTVDCEGRQTAECDLGLDGESLEHVFKADPRSRQEELLQLDRFQASAKELQRRLGGASAKAGSSSLKALEKQEADLEKQNRLEQNINRLLKNNARLAKQNAVLSKAGRAPEKGLQQLHTHVQLDAHGNPPGVPEQVPATVSAPPPGVPDFNGASGVVAQLPSGLGFAPSRLDANGVEERGSFTLRKANPYGGIWIRAYGKMNHPIKCTLKSYRKLSGMFMGQTVYTGYKKSWSGKTTISTGIIPPGGSNTFDIITCRDMQTGEVQHFRTYPTPSPGFFADPGDPAFQDEYTSHAITPDHP